MCKWEAAKPCVALPDSSEDSDSKAMDAKAKRCATEGCLYEATKGEYCCGACAKGKRCGHGRHCEHTLFKGNEPEIKKVACKPCAASGCNYQAGLAGWCWGLDKPLRVVRSYCPEHLLRGLRLEIPVEPYNVNLNCAPKSAKKCCLHRLMLFAKSG